MSQQRYNQRHPLAPPSPALNHANNRAELTPFAVPAQPCGGRIVPGHHDIAPINSRPNPNEPITDVKFEQACKGFFEATVRLQMIALLFFFVLMFATQVAHGHFTAALIVYLVFTCIYTFIRLPMIILGEMDCVGRLIMVCKLVESFVGIIFIATWANNEDSFAVVIFVILLISYLARMIYSYCKNMFEHSKFGNYMARIVLLLRALVLIQSVLVLVQLRLRKQLTWFIVVIPAWIIFVIITIFTITLFRRVYFVFEDELWKNNKKTMRRVSRWIFGNLFTLACLVLVILILVPLVYDGHISDSSNPFLGPFICIVVWCPISLFWAYRMRAEIPKVMQKIGDTLDGKKVEKEDKEEEEDHEIKYVIKMSNTYFKPAQKKEVKEYKKWKKSIFKCWKRKPEAKAGLKRMPTESGKCVICYINISDGVFMKCGHGGICFECGEQILKTRKECHLCREKVKSLLNIKMNTKNMNAIYYKVKKEIRPLNEP